MKKLMTEWRKRLSEQSQSTEEYSYKAGNWKLQLVNAVNALAMRDIKPLAAVLRGPAGDTIIKNSGLQTKKWKDVARQLISRKGKERIEYMHKLCGGDCRK